MGKGEGEAASALTWFKSNKYDLPLLVFAVLLSSPLFFTLFVTPVPHRLVIKKNIYFLKLVLKTGGSALIEKNLRKFKFQRIFTHRLE